MPKKNTPTHGGRRPGSGRKPLAEDCTMVLVKFPLPLVMRLDEYAAASEISRSAAVRQAVTELLQRVV